MRHRNGVTAHSGCNLTPTSCCARVDAVYLKDALRHTTYHPEESAIGQPVPVAGRPSTWMRRTVHISGQIEPFFGTLDDNGRLLEEGLHVRTHLHDTRLTIEGAQDHV